MGPETGDVAVRVGVQASVHSLDMSAGGLTATPGRQLGSVERVLSVEPLRGRDVDSAAPRQYNHRPMASAFALLENHSPGRDRDAAPELDRPVWFCGRTEGRRVAFSFGLGFRWWELELSNPGRIWPRRQPGRSIASGCLG